MRITALVEPGRDGVLAELLLLNLCYWYVPALFSKLVVLLAHQFRFERPGWPRALGVHVAALAVFSVVHVLCMCGVRILLFGEYAKPLTIGWWPFIQRQYLQNMDWAMMTYASIVGITHAVSYYREAQHRKVRSAQLETQLVEAELKTLQAELHPHFLFNTLHAISTLVHRDPNAADKMIVRLSDLLRLTLDHAGVQETSLKEELEFLQKYLEIEQIRFRDRLNVRFDVDPDVLDVPVPRLILQPLVENAIRHGIGPRSGDGLIEISARPDGDRLWVQVRDNGVGLSGGALTALEKGIGLSNTRARLHCLYGADYRFEFSNRGGGLTVRIVIPLKREATASPIPPRRSRVA
jgi:signal transduction histidine kinase